MERWIRDHKVSCMGYHSYQAYQHSPQAFLVLRRNDVTECRNGILWRLRARPMTPRLSLQRTPGVFMILLNLCCVLVRNTNWRRLLQVLKTKMR